MVLDYAPRPKNKGSETAFCIVSWIFILVGPPAAILVSAMMHTYRVRFDPIWLHPSPQDLLASAVAVGFPMAGLVTAALAALRPRWRTWAGGAIVMHVYLLWAFERMEIFFWRF
jgi:hypothetical protein